MKNRLAGFVCLFFVVLAAHAEPQLRALPIESALGASSLGPWQPVALSADHAYLAYIACDARKKRQLEQTARAAGIVYAYGERWYLGCGLRVAATAGGKTVTVTAEDSFSHGPAWSPDGRQLAYVAGGGEQQRLHVWDRDSQRSRQVVAGKTALLGAAVPLWLPDNRHVLVLTPRAKPDEPEDEPASAPPRAEAPATTVKVYRSAAAMGDKTAPPAGPWAIDEGSVSLVLVDTASETSRVILAHAPKTGSFNYMLSPDGRSVAYARATRFSGPTSQQMLMEIHVASLADGEDVILARDVPLLFGWGLSWSPDSRSLAWLTAGVQAPYDLTVHDLSSGASSTIRYAERPPNATELSFSRLTRTSSEGVPPAVWNANGRELYVTDILQQAVWKVRPAEATATALFRLPGEQVLGVVRHGNSFPAAADNKLHVFTGNERSKQTSFHEVDLATGVARKLWSRDARLTGVVGSADGKALAYIEQAADRSPEAWVRPMPAGQPRRISHIATEFDSYVFGKSRLIGWTTARGEQLQGVLILPAGHDPRKRYPLIVFPYGGGYKSHTLHSFAGGEGGLMATTDNLQLFATRGYAVLLPDAPGRTGTLMTDFADSIMPGVDRAIALGVADPERLGVMGHSNGGYTVMCLIAQTDRFKAAVSRAGFSDYTSLAFSMSADGSNYALNIAEDLQLGGSLWQERSRWIDNSPLFLFDRVHTPTLIVHGDADAAVAPFMADQSFVALRRLDRIVEYARYGGEGHSEDLWSYPNRLDYLTRVIGWFERFLRP